MRYLVRRKIERNDSPFIEQVSTRADSEQFEFPNAVESLDLVDDKEVGEVRRDPRNEDVFLSIPFILIEPLQDPAEDVRPPATVWGLDAVGATSSPFDGRGVTVAVLDTGIDTKHEAFTGVDFPARNLMDFTNNPDGEPGSATDQGGHGTHVAGTLFGRDVDGRRIGVAPGVNHVLIGKVFGPDGRASTEAIYSALTWALKEHADIISMSLGINFPGIIAQLIDQGLPSDIAASRALDAYRGNVRLFDDLAKMVEGRVKEGRGALLIAASGNASRRKENRNFTVGTMPPANADGFIAVGAVRQTSSPAASFEVAAFSNTGCALSGPGVSILSAQLGGGLVTKNGTSMATPHVAGVAALWTQQLMKGSVKRPRGWARDVQRALETHVVAPAGLDRVDIGLGIVQAPQG